jgi:serine/threonine protein kinase
MSIEDEIKKYEPLWGNWHVEFPIGKGSFGTVYKISREDMGNKYEAAVKHITVPTEEQFREAESTLGTDEKTLTLYFEDIVKSIVDEIKILYSLSGYTNILNYQDHIIAKRNDNIGWDVLIKMEYVQSLTEYQKMHQFTPDDVIKLGIDVCTALEICAKKGVIHRDIKEENIFINEDGIFKIGDFGIAKEFSNSGSVAASKRGTPLYMAPEVYREEKYTSVVDIYSLGIVMYKLLNHGRMPFMPPFPETVRYQDAQDALRRRLSGEALPFPDMSDEKLGRIVLKAAAFQPKERYQTASEFCGSLRRVNEPAPIEQHPAGVVENPNTPESMLSNVHPQEPDEDLNKTASVFTFSDNQPSPHDIGSNNNTPDQGLVSKSPATGVQFPHFLNSVIDDHSQENKGPQSQNAVDDRYHQESVKSETDAQGFNGDLNKTASVFTFTDNQPSLQDNDSSKNVLDQGFVSKSPATGVQFPHFLNSEIYNHSQENVDSAKNVADKINQGANPNRSGNDVLYPHFRFEQGQRDPRTQGFAQESTVKNSSIRIFKRPVTKYILAALILLVVFAIFYVSSFLANTVNPFATHYDSFWIKKYSDYNSLSWSCPIDVDGFEIYRSIDNADHFALICRTEYSNYNDFTIMEGHYYYYRIRAYRHYFPSPLYGSFSEVQFVDR